DAEPVPVEAAPEGPSAKILVVDDEPMILRLAQRVLGEQHSVTVAGGGARALELLEQGERFDVILCDVLMADLTGVDFHEQLLAKYPALAPRVVFISASAFTARSMEFLSSVPNRCLEKPFLQGELKKVVTDVIREQGLLPAPPS